MARPPTPSSLIKTLCSLAQPLAAAASDRHDRPGGPARQKLTAATRKRKEDGASSDAILFDQNLVLAGSALGGSSLRSARSTRRPCSSKTDRRHPKTQRGWRVLRRHPL